MLNFFRHKYRLKIIQNFFFILFFLTISQNIKAADKSLSFDGTDDYVEIPANNVLNPTGDYTVAAWFKQEGENSNEVSGNNNDFQSIITSRTTTGSGVRGYMMYLRSTTNVLSYWIGRQTGGNFVENNTTSVSTWKANGGGNPGTPGWNYYVIRFNGSNQTSIFLDGVLLNTITSSDTMNNQNTDKPTRIGAGNTNETTPRYLSLIHI